MIRYLFVVIAVSCSFSTPSFAEDFQPEEIPFQWPLMLLKAKGVRDVYYLVTKDHQHENKQDSGNHYVLVHENGKLRFPRQTIGLVHFDGGSMDFRFENGERLVIPTEQFSVGYLGVNMTPMMMSADKAPLKLQRVEITPAILKRLGLYRFISPFAKLMPRQTESKRSEYVPFVSPETAQIVQFEPGRKLEGKEDDQISKLINELDPSHIRTDDRVDQGAFYGYGETKIIVITDPENSLPKLHAKLEGIGHVSVVSEAYLNDVLRNFETIKSKFQEANEATKLAYIEQIHETMGELERYFLMADRMAQYETAVASRLSGITGAGVGSAKNLRARRSHPFYGTAIAKIRNTARIGFETLDQIGHPAAQEILTHTAQEFDYVALDIVKGKATVGQQYYFDLWLKFMLSDLDFADKLSENGTELPPVRVRRVTGGLFQDFKISGEISIVQGRGIFHHFLDTRPKFLLFLLGMPGQKERLKTSLIQFVIDADKKAAKIVAWSDRVDAARNLNSYGPDTFAAKSVTHITDMFEYLARTQYTARAIEGFSSTEYQTSVMDIFTTLFDIASTSLKTTGTMTALINASVHVLNEFQITKSGLGVKPRSRAEQAAQVLENRLRIHLQKSVASLGFVRSDEAVSSCAILLAPDSEAQARKANGW